MVVRLWNSLSKQLPIRTSSLEFPLLGGLLASLVFAGFFAPDGLMPALFHYGLALSLLFLSLQDMQRLSVKHESLGLCLLFSWAAALSLGEPDYRAALFVSLALYLLELAYRLVFKRIGLGFGDIKLLMIMSIYLSYASFFVLAFACVFVLISLGFQRIFSLRALGSNAGEKRAGERSAASRSAPVLSQTFPFVPALSICFLLLCIYMKFAA